MPKGGFLMEMFLEYLWAFVIGGVLCVIGQLLIDFTKLTPARILVGYVVAGVIISAVGLYQPLVDFAGCGATVPLTGFGHLLAKGVRQAIGSDGFIGILTGGLTAAAGGIAASVFFGYVVSLFAKPKMRS
jgi:stage V sporulation protein AE